MPNTDSPFNDVRALARVNWTHTKDDVIRGERLSEAMKALLKRKRDEVVLAAEGGACAHVSVFGWDPADYQGEGRSQSRGQDSSAVGSADIRVPRAAGVLSVDKHAGRECERRLHQGASAAEPRQGCGAYLRCRLAAVAELAQAGLHRYRHPAPLLRLGHVPSADPHERPYVCG